MKKYLVLLVLALLLVGCTTLETKTEEIAASTYNQVCWDLGGLVSKDGCVMPEVCKVEQSDSQSDISDTSCVKRMIPGDKAQVFTETWDSETRVWVHKEGGTCEGPYCFSYDSCNDPDVTLTLQPFWTGHELSPVNGKPFVVCYNFEGDCSR